MIIANVDSVRELPACALCGNQAWFWITDRNQRPYLEIALCSEHVSRAAEFLPQIRKEWKELNKPVKKEEKK